MQTTLPAKSKEVGSAVSRVDGRAKVTGAALYAAEAKIENPLHAVLVASERATGTYSLDTTTALKLPGIGYILTPDNLPKLQPNKGAIGGDSKRLPLSDHNILYFGQALAVIIADTLDHARAAVPVLTVNYTEGPSPVVDYRDERAKKERPEKNMGENLQETKGNPAEALKQPGPGGASIAPTYETPPEHHNPMELHATVAQWSDDGKHLTIWDASQHVVGVQGALAKAFSIPEQNIRVLCPFVGGGFGSKGAQWPHTVLTAAAAMAVKQPVKLMLTRSQMFYAVGHRPPTTQTVSLAADKEAKLQALQHDVHMHASLAGDFIEPAAMGTSRVLYATPNLGVSHEIARVNVGTPTFMRAPGETPGTYALECAMDELALALNIDPVELRLKNFAETHPASGKPFSSNHVRECYTKGAKLFGWSKRNPAPGSMKDDQGRQIGYGVATATYPGYRFGATARLRLLKDPASPTGFKALGQSSIHDLGTGAYTIATQMTADFAGLPLSACRFELGDTNLPIGPVAGGSNTTASIAQALADAAQDLRENLLKLAPPDSPLKEHDAWTTTLKNGRLVSTKDDSRSIAVAELLAKSDRPFLEGNSSVAGKTNQERISKQGDATPPDAPENYAANAQKYAFQSHGVHFVEVAIDPLMPRIQVSRVVSVMDIGRVINPKLARSQILGGITMGIGMALMEETLYDPTTARPVNANLADYPVPTHADTPPDITVEFLDYPDLKLDALGARGVGEIGITGIAAAIANAVHHATAKRLRTLPLTPDKLLA